MSWLQISLTVDGDRAPLLEAVMENAGALAVTLDDAGADPLLEPPPGTIPLWRGVRLTALFDDSQDSQTLVEDLAEWIRANLSATPRIERLEDRPWERVWLESFKPTRFGRRLWVCPRDQSAPDPDGVVVDLDPGLAFGTGHHPTTALCLEWLDGSDLVGRTLLDYGCGSGILAIAALKLGAAHAIAVDHDPQAIEATRANADRNGVLERLSACMPEELGGLGGPIPSDLVIANILAGPLVELAPILLSHLRPGGDLVLSGVLLEQVEAVSDAYRRDSDLEPVRIREDWALIAGVRR